MRWRWRKDRERDLERELRSHMELEAEERHDPAAARRALGNLTQVKEDVRETWPLASLGTANQDIRYALRQMRRNPAFTAIAVLTLMLGLGATTTIFTVVESILLRPLAYREPERLVRLYESQLPRFSRGSVSYPNLQDIRAQARSLSLIQAYNAIGAASLLNRGEAERVNVAGVEARMFEM